MDRRLIGALLVVAVVAVAIVVPARDGLRIAGIPTAIELPADPELGDCLLPGPAGTDPSHPSTTPSGSRDHRSAAEAPPVFGPCTSRPVAGELVAIVAATGDDRQRRLQAESSGVDCRTAALSYAGLALVDGRYQPRRHSSSDPVLWEFSIALRTTWLLPSPVLQAAGRNWAACVAAPTVGTGYVGRLADAYGTGRLPDSFGVCWSTREVSVAIRKVDCRSSHLAELIALGTVPEGATVGPADVDASCRRLAAEVLGRQDPTADGGLAVLVSPDINDSIRWTTESHGVVCYVIPDRESLVGTLVGLGDRPIPYSG